jgi:hypothetical protein
MQIDSLEHLATNIYKSFRASLEKPSMDDVSLTQKYCHDIYKLIEEIAGKGCFYLKRESNTARLLEKYILHYALVQLPSENLGYLIRDGFYPSHPPKLTDDLVEQTFDQKTPYIMIKRLSFIYSVNIRYGEILRTLESVREHYVLSQTEDHVLTPILAVKNC